MRFDEEDRYLTDEEVAAQFPAHIRPSRRAVQRWRLEEGLPYITVGRRPLVLLSDFEAWLEHRKVNSAEVGPESGQRSRRAYVARRRDR
jgi:hypothetical protein